MDSKMLARLVAVVAIAVAVTTTAIHLARQDTPSESRSPSNTIEPPRREPLRTALQRCRDLGEAATRDMDCLAAWDKNRRRFISPSEGR